MTLRVLVTGGCGFVGIPVLQQLIADGHDVVAFDDLSRGGEARLEALSEPPRLIVGDIRDGDLLSRSMRSHRSELVIHLAAMHFIPDCNRDPVACMSVNVVGTQSVLDAIRSNESVKGIVHASTAAVYEPDRTPHIEHTSRIAPDDVYGHSKLAAESLVTEFGKRAGLPVALARLFNVYGPGETNEHLIPAVVRQAIEGVALKVGNLTTTRDYVFTTDVARGVALLAKRAIDGHTLTCNLGTGISRSGQDVIDLVGAILGNQLVTVPDPTRSRRTDRPVLLADTGLARQILGWEPRVAFEDGLGQVIGELMHDGGGVASARPPATIGHPGRAAG